MTSFAFRYAIAFWALAGLGNQAFAASGYANCESFLHEYDKGLSSVHINADGTVPGLPGDGVIHLDDEEIGFLMENNHVKAFILNIQDDRGSLQRYVSARGTFLISEDGKRCYPQHLFIRAALQQDPNLPWTSSKRVEFDLDACLKDPGTDPNSICNTPARKRAVQDFLKANPGGRPLYPDDGDYQGPLQNPMDGSNF